MPDCPKCGKRMIKNGGERGKPRFVCYTLEGTKKLYCYSTRKRDTSVIRTQSGKITKPRHKTPIFKRTLGGVNRFIVTAAQNATPVHAKFLKSLEIACNHLNAELLVIPIRYKNPTSRWSASQSNDETWDPKIAPYLWNTRKALNKNLIVLGDIKTQPTASAPLTGFDAITGAESGILGHTKLQLRCIPTPSHKLPKILTTTGAVTIPNYTDSKAGAIGAFHHSLGASLVEVQGKKFHLRQILADKNDGSFCDLSTSYEADKGVTHNVRASALVLGDVHVDFLDTAVERATFGVGGMVECLRPEKLVYHDLLDGYSVNHHHLGNPFTAIAKLRGGREDAREELLRAFAFVEKHAAATPESYVVASNHDDFLSRWIMAQDWKAMPKNAEFYLETALAMVRGTRFGASGAEYPSPLTYWGRKHFCANPKVTFLDRDQSLLVSDIELGLHGDSGPNGVKGSIKNLRRIGLRSIIGHSHSPGIDEGAFQCGTSTRLRLEYNRGPSSWLNTHCVVYRSGKRSLLTIVDGEWRL